MEKNITIDDKTIVLKSKASTALIYSGQFGVDFFADILKLASMFPTDKKGKIKEDTKDWNDEEISKINFEVIYRFLWAAAKTADRQIPAPLDWFDQFEELNIIEIIPEIQDLMLSSFQSKKASRANIKVKKR